jgi:hypothetical protein
MAVEYQLTLAGDIPLEEVAAVAAPEAAEIPTPSGGGRLFTADLRDRYGYGVSIFGGRDGYCEAEDGDGSRWEWELESYVDVIYRLSKDQPTDRATSNVVTAVARVLASRAEDAALVLNGNWLLLTRMGGTLRKHRPTWWNTYGVDGLI